MTKDEQFTLLQQVLSANDAEGDEEKIPGEGGSRSTLKAGNLASLSGADDAVYTEYKKFSTNKHPLFKKFRT